MKKVLQLCLIVFLGFITIGVSGCMRGLSNSKKNEMKIYLNEKYNKNFVFVSNGNEPFFSSYKTFYYADESGNEVEVRQENNEYLDNYYSVLFDQEIERDYRVKLNNDTKFYISTSDFYTGNVKYTSTQEYITQCTLVMASMIVKSKNNVITIAESVKDVYKDIRMIVFVSEVEENDFEIVSGYSDINKIKNIKSTDSFKIINNNVVRED